MTFYLVIFFLSLLNFFSLGYSYSETSGTDSGGKNINNTTGTSSSTSIIEEFNFTNIINMLKAYGFNEEGKYSVPNEPNLYNIIFYRQNYK